MKFEPTPSQALLLFSLLARHGECPQAELMPAVKKADREALVKAKLAASEKRGRGLYLSLTDAGWEWAGTHLAAELPPAFQTLSDLLLRLSDNLEKSGQTLADFIGGKPEATDSSPSMKAPRIPRAAKGAMSKAKASKATASKSTASKVLTPAALRNRIEAAYLAVTGQRKDRSVKLSQLRAELADLDRVTIDGGLGRILAGDKKASLMRHDDPRQLDQSDQEAAFSPAGEPFHVLWIAS